MKVYTSRVDGWIAALLIGVLAYDLGLAIYLARVDPVAAWLTVAVGLFMGVLLLLLGVPCRYILKDDHLLVRSGLLRYQVPYDEIVGVEKSSSPLSAPAWSLRRVKILKRKGYLLVSPADREEFMRELRKRFDSEP
ncbi:MAG: PH domain-containing protein [Desulfobulbaceae bacterium]